MCRNNNWKRKIKKGKLLGLLFCFTLIAAPLVFLANNHQEEINRVDAADYSGVDSGFTHNSDGSVTATFNVTNNGLDMKGWLLCLFSSEPSVDDNKKLIDSNDAHPYSYSGCSRYYFASNTSQTGSITVTWPANAGNQKSNWTTSSTGDQGTGQTLKENLESGTNWHLVIGPRHYNTSWSGSGIGAGTDGYWENCDYYVGALNTVFPEDDKDMSVTVTPVEKTYNGATSSLGIKVKDPSSGYTIKYRTTSSGSYNLTTNPEYKDAGTYTTYFQITSSGYKTYEGSGTVKINKANPSYTAPSAKSGLTYNENDQVLLNAGSSNVLYSLDGTNYSSSVPTGKNAGSYTVYFKVEESKNYKGLDPKTISVSIAKANPVYTSPTAKTGLVYNQSSQALVNAGSSNILYSLDGASYSSSVPTGIDAGTYTIYYKIEETTNYKGLDPQTVVVNIAKADHQYADPTAKTGLVYNKADQALINAGSSTSGTILYSLDNENYSSTVPTGQNAGTYTIYYKIEETPNYKPVEVKTIEVTIAKAQAEYNTLPAVIEGLYYNGEYQNLITKGNPTGGTISYSFDDETYFNDVPTKKLVGTYTVYFRIDGDNNYIGVEAESLSISIYENDKTALKAVISNANTYLGEISSSYPSIASSLEDAINDAQSVSDDANKTVEEIDAAIEDVLDAVDLAHAEIVDTLISDIGDVRYSDKCEKDIIKAEEAYSALSEAQKALVTNLSKLTASRNLYNKLKAVGEVVNAIGEVSYDQDCYERILNAKEAFNALSEEEQLLIPTIFNDLNSAEDIYEMLEIIANLGDVTYSEEFNAILHNARNAFDALDPEEQKAVYNYQDLLDAEKMYQNIDKVVQLVNAIAEELEYVGTHNPDIDKARAAYNSLTPEEQALVPQLTIEALQTAEEEYEELKIEHEKKEIEDREAGVAIAIDGASGIPDTVSIDINSSSSSQQDFVDNIDYQAIADTIGENETISSMCEIKFYEEIDGEMVAISLEDIDDNLSITVKIDLPDGVDEDNFKVILFADDSEILELEYTYDPINKVITVVSNRIGTFAVVSTNTNATAKTNDLPIAIILAVIVIALIAVVGYFSIRGEKKNG